jgi:RNA polymerase sigma-70 factor (ECF subfamily)
MVVEAGRGASPKAREAFGGLYRAYAAPLYAYLRHKGHGPDDAQDLLQGFFESLLSKDSLSRVDRDRKFRAWLLTSLKFYLSDARDKARAAIRNAGRPLEVLGVDVERFEVDPPHPGRTPDEEFDRKFALRFLQLVLEELAAEYRLSGRQNIYDALASFLLDKQLETKHAEIGPRLGMSADGVAKAISRLRERFRNLLDRAVRNMIGIDGDVSAEKDDLFRALRR